MNIKDAILQLIEAGFSEGRIAKEIGCASQPTIHRIKTGAIKNPSFQVGTRILELHAKHVVNDPATAA